MNNFYFSKFTVGDKDITLTASSDRRAKREKKKKQIKNEKLGLFMGRNAKDILKKAEKLEAKKKILAYENPDELNEFEERKRWQMASMKAQGVKIKTKISLIRKAAKRQEKRKEKSKKCWTKRLKDMQRQVDARQHKRNQNIQARKDAKKQKKYKRLIKKGHIIPELKNS